MDIYRELILDHYKHPRNFGHLDHPDSSITEDNVSCGDRICMEIICKKIDSATIIDTIAFSGEGCAISQASSSLLTEDVLGKTLEYVLALHTDYIIDMLGTTLTPARIKCATLPLEVLQKAIQKYINNS